MASLHSGQTPKDDTTQGNRSSSPGLGAARFGAVEYSIFGGAISSHFLQDKIFLSLTILKNKRNAVSGNGQTKVPWLYG